MGIRIDEDTLNRMQDLAFYLAPVLIGVGTGALGGHFVRALAKTPLLQTGAVALVQTVVGMLGIHRPIAGSFETIQQSTLGSVVSMMVSQIAVGVIIYGEGALAINAGLMMGTALTLPTVASLIVVPAVLGTVAALGLGKAIDCACDREWIVKV